MVSLWRKNRKILPSCTIHNERYTPSHDKSSYGLWPGELIKEGSSYLQDNICTKFLCHYNIDQNLLRGIIESRLGDAVGMNQKVILERDDPRRLSATIAPIPSPPTKYRYCILSMKLRPNAPIFSFFYRDICKFWCAEKEDSWDVAKHAYPNSG
jgi:hypothetical protein